MNEEEIKQEARDEMQQVLKKCFEGLPKHPLMEIVMNEFRIKRLEEENKNNLFE